MKTEKSWRKERYLDCSIRECQYLQIREDHIPQAGMNGKGQKDDIKCSQELESRIALSIVRRPNAGLQNNLTGLMKPSLYTPNDIDSASECIRATGCSCPVCVCGISGGTFHMGSKSVCYI